LGEPIWLSCAGLARPGHVQHLHTNVAGLLHHVDSADEENLADSYATAFCVVHLVLLNILVMPTSVHTEM